MSYQTHVLPSCSDLPSPLQTHSSRFCFSQLLPLLLFALLAPLSSKRQSVRARSSRRHGQTGTDVVGTSYSAANSWVRSCSAVSSRAWLNLVFLSQSEASPRIRTRRKARQLWRAFWMLSRIRTRRKALRRVVPAHLNSTAS